MAEFDELTNGEYKIIEYDSKKKLYEVKQTSTGAIHWMKSSYIM